MITIYPEIFTLILKIYSKMDTSIDRDFCGTSFSEFHFSKNHGILKKFKNLTSIEKLPYIFTKLTRFLLKVPTRH